MTFNINGREYNDFELSNEEVLVLLESDKISAEERSCLMERVLCRFKHGMCPRPGEGKDELFAHQFSDYVNRCPNDFEKATDTMARDHRYLQQEMFKVCLSYMKKLAQAFQNGCYDPRNEWACKTASEAINHLTEAKLI